MLANQLEEIIALAKAAGEAVLEIYTNEQPLDIRQKSDNTPVTIADMQAHGIIVSGLKKITPDIPVLSEEAANIPFATRRHWQQYWLLDPLDGTKEFIGRTGDFSINIALISDHQPILGVIYGPVSGICYYALTGQGAFKHVAGQLHAVPIHSSPCDIDHLRIAVSRRHSVDKVRTRLGHLPDVQLTLMGSSFKSCLVAEGQVDLYPRMGDTSEWDTAAAQCIVEEAGGMIMDLEGQRLEYNRRDSLINPWFLVVGDKQINWLNILKIGEN